jgi:hypothetical protein
MAILGSFGSQAKKSFSRPRRRHGNADEMPFYLLTRSSLVIIWGLSEAKSGLVIAIALE